MMPPAPRACRRGLNEREEDAPTELAQSYHNDRFKLLNEISWLRCSDIRSLPFQRAIDVRGAANGARRFGDVDSKHH
eukprot:2276839-Rhodomonas_salina.3